MGDVKHQSDNLNPHHLLGYGHNVTKRIPTFFVYNFFFLQIFNTTEITIQRKYIFLVYIVVLGSYHSNDDDVMTFGTRPLCSFAFGFILKIIKKKYIETEKNNNKIICTYH